MESKIEDTVLMIYDYTVNAPCEPCHAQWYHRICSGLGKFVEMYQQLRSLDTDTTRLTTNECRCIPSLLQLTARLAV